MGHPSHFHHPYQGNPEVIPGQSTDIISPLGLPRAQNTCQGGIPTSFPKHLNWLLSMWSSGSALISFWISECLAPSLRLNPDTLRSKLISVACIPDPDDRWRLECRLAVKQRAWLSAVSSSRQACLDPCQCSAPFFCLLGTRTWTTWTQLITSSSGYKLPACSSQECVEALQAYVHQNRLFFFWSHFGSLFVPEFSLPMLHCQERYSLRKRPKWMNSWRCDFSEVCSKMQHVSKASLKIPLMEQNRRTLLR